MIKSIIQAGFGNQLFQYATGYALAKEFQCGLVIDISFYDSKRNLEADNRRWNNLDKLKIEPSLIVNNPRAFLKYRIGENLKLPLLRRLWSMGELIIWEDVTRCREFQKDLFNKIDPNRDVTLYGFWQNTQYFRSVLPDLKKQFVPNYTLPPVTLQYSAATLEHDNSVGVHIRRGDFVGLGWNKSVDFYAKAMKRLEQEISNPHFFIVTDDKSWARKNMPLSSNITIVDINTETSDIDEFLILSQCRHHIISESTYGWWAAFLNSDSKGLVVVPENAKGEIFDQGWIRM